MTIEPPATHSLVTGGAGFIGNHLTHHLLEKGWSVRVVDNLSSGSLRHLERDRGNPRLQVMVADLKDSDVARKALEGVDCVYHLAANPEVRVSTQHPKVHFEENIVVTFNLLEAIRQRGDVESLVFASSCTVYGEPKRNPVSEKDPMSPVSVYGSSKAACENLLCSYSRLYGFAGISLRYANIVGPDSEHGVVPDFVGKLRLNSAELEILGDGTQRRSYVHVQDTIRATVTAYEKTHSTYEVYNVGNEDWITVNQVADIVREAMGLENVRYTYRPMLHGVGWRGDVKEILMKTTKIRRLGWKPLMNSPEAVRATAEDLLVRS